MARHGRGEGSVHQRHEDGLWVGRVSWGYEAGKRKRKAVYGRSRAEVSQAVRALLKAREDGLAIPSKRLTVTQYLERWLSGMRPNVRGSTFVRYRHLIRRQLVPHLGRIVLSRLTPADLSAAYAAMMDADGISARTAGHAHRVLGRALRDAEVAGLVVRNVCRLVHPPRVPHIEMRTFTAEQAKALIAGSRETRLGALFTIAVVTGARQGEVLALRWSDVDFAAGTVGIQRTLQRGVEGFELTEPKTTSARRTIPLGAAALDALRRHRKAQAEERLRAGPAWADQDLIFATEIGTPIDAGNLLRRDYYPLLARLGLPRLPFHSLRHTCATLLVASGAHIRTIAERLGHADPALTLRTYSHVAVGLQAQATATLDTVLGA